MLHANEGINAIPLLVGSFFLVVGSHAAIGAGLYATAKGSAKVWMEHETARPYLIGTGVAAILAGVFLFKGVLSGEASLYLTSLNWLTGFLHDNFDMRGATAFWLSRFALKMWFMIPLSIGGIFYMNFKKNGSPGNPQKQKRLFPKRIKQQWMAKYRDSGDGAFIGITNERRPHYFTEEERGMHTQVIGATGFGKTASVLMPLLRHDLRMGKSVIFIDGKGDMEALGAFATLAEEAGRGYDVFIFSPSYPNLSNPWNPLASGNPIVQKDRIVGAQIWTEEYYKKKGEDLLQTVFQIFDDLKVTPSFPRLSRFLKNPEVDFIKGRKFRDKEIEADYKNLKLSLKNDAKQYAGIIADIDLMAKSFLKSMFEEDQNDGISLFEAVMRQKVVYFHLPVLMMEETMKRIARMVIHEMKIVCSELQNYVGKRERPRASLYIDEFASFATENFIELLNKARSAGVGTTLIHQSLGDIESVSVNFACQVFENTNNKIILHIDDPGTIERYCRMAGTHQEMKYTYQTDDSLLGMSKTGMGTMREVEAFNIDPNAFRFLGIGEAVVFIKSTDEEKRRCAIVKLDYINPPQADLSEYAEEARKIVFEGESSEPAGDSETLTEDKTEMSEEIKPVSKGKLNKDYWDKDNNESS